MKTLHLTIDAQDNNATKVMLDGKGFQEVIVNKDISSHSQVILPFIEKALKKHGRALSDIQDITVAVDHGSFTGRRVATAIATMLGHLLHIPVNGEPAEKAIDIPYEEDKWK